jgi:hypothetical protein
VISLSALLDFIARNSDDARVVLSAFAATAVVPSHSSERLRSLGPTTAAAYVNSEVTLYRPVEPPVTRRSHPGEHWASFCRTASVFVAVARTPCSERALVVLPVDELCRTSHNAPRDKASLPCKLSHLGQTVRSVGGVVSIALPQRHNACAYWLGT